LRSEQVAPFSREPASAAPATALAGLAAKRQDESIHDTYDNRSRFHDISDPASPPQDRAPLHASVDLPKDGRKPTERLPPGSVVDVLDRDGIWVGRGFYNAHSRITLRILTNDANEPIDRCLLRAHHRPGR